MKTTFEAPEPAPEPRPAPVVKVTVCSLCDLPWEDHGENPTILTCVELLKKKPPKVITLPITYPTPNIPCIPTPPTAPSIPYWTINSPNTNSPAISLIEETQV